MFNAQLEESKIVLTNGGYFLPLETNLRMSTKNKVSIPILDANRKAK